MRLGLSPSLDSSYHTSNLLTRPTRIREGISFTASQVQMDSILGHFAGEAGNVGNLLAMSGGAFAYRLARTGFLSAGLCRGLASLGALSAEVSAFRGASNLLASLQGQPVSERIFDSRGWFSTLISFGILKGSAFFAQGQNLVFTHALQSSAMVAGNQVAYSLSLTYRPQGSLLEQLVHAESTNLALSAGSSFMGLATGHRLAALEKSFELRSEAIIEAPSSSPQSFHPPWAWANAGTNPLHEVSSRSPIRFQNWMAMSAQVASVGRIPGGIGRVEVLSEPAINDFWREHLEPGNIAHNYLHLHPEAARLFRALQRAQETLSSASSQRDFLNEVLKNLQSSQGVAGREYKTRYAVISAVEVFDRELDKIISQRKEAGASPGLFERHLARYEVDFRGRMEWGVNVNEGRPHQALESALSLLPTHETGELLEEHEGRSLASRLEEARALLARENVKVVAVWGAGRHGLALGDWVRQSAGKKEMIDGHYIIPIMLGHRPDFTYELNVDGTNEKQLPGIPINEPDHLALRAAHPLRNSAYLSIADSVLVTLPSTELKKEFTPEFIQGLAPQAQLIFAIKSILNEGESVPGFVCHTLARVGRLDLLLHVAFQSGLGFPKEMFGRIAPDAPVNLAVDALNLDAALRAAKLFMGDQSTLSAVSEHKRILVAVNKRIDAGVLIFKGAYGGFIKNFIAPWVGYRLMEHYISHLARMSPAQMRSRLAELQEEAKGLAERIFVQHERQAILREVGQIEQVVKDPRSTTEEDWKGSWKPILDWIAGVRERLAHYRERDTATEDLLGCTRIRDMDVFLRIVGDLLDPKAKGLVFERRLDELTMRARSQASSTNFAYGLLARVYLELVHRHLIVERPPINFTAEGINGLPNVAKHWQGEPDFVKEILAWINPSPEPRGRPALHASGLRRHALRVTRDYIDAMEDRTHPIILNSLSAKEQKPIVREILRQGKEMVLRLRREEELFPPVSAEIRSRIDGTLVDFERFVLLSDRFLSRLDDSRAEANQAIKNYIKEYRRILIEVRNQLEGAEEWMTEDVMEKIRENMALALTYIEPPSPPP